MNRDPDGVSAAEEQLIELLHLLRSEGIEPGEALAEAVMRSVEWQVLLRGTIVLVGDLVGSMAAALALFLSSPSQAAEQTE